MDSAREILQEIAKTQAFNRLEAFRDAVVWQSLPPSDQELLASLLVTQGEQQLNLDEGLVLRAFNAANEIAPESAEIQLRIGVALASKVSDANCLSLSLLSFARAAVLRPTCFDIWFQWGISLTRLGILREELDDLNDAESRFLTALTLAQNKQQEGCLFWRRAICWFAMGRLSGEAVEYRTSIDFMHRAASSGLDESNFWNDYGFLMQEFGVLLSRQDSLRQALEFFQKSVRQNPNFFEAWLNLAMLTQKLFHSSGERSFFIEADQAFRQATLLSQDSFELWLAWGQLYLGYGKAHRDVEVLRSALEKYEKAASIHADLLVVLSGWAEVQVLLGTYLERLDLLREAHRKSLICVESSPDSPRLWYLAGICLNELGRYFNDESYLQQALTKLKTGLQLAETDPLLWYGLAQVYCSLSETNRDQEVLEQAAFCCSKVIELGGEGIPQFYNDWGVTLTRLGEVTQQKGYVETAIQKFELAIAQQNRSGSFGHDREGVEPEWLYNYGCALEILGELTASSSCYEKAINALSQVIILDPTFSHARYNLAVAFSRLGELMSEVECLQRAFDLFQAIVEQDSEDDAAWSEWGFALICLGQLLRDPARPDLSAALFEQAEAKLLQASSLGNTSSYYNLACLYNLVGNYPAAMFYLERTEAVKQLPPLEAILYDEWLEGVRGTSEFRGFVQQLEIKNRQMD